ncbi:hypothetical protein E8E14_014694 [Neopestalotiopsis sp. 37M]|nr:hypothetical protein E8E14_014694 [Neopestalotiopsis sp. 37M]
MSITDMSQTSVASLSHGENPPKPTVAMTRNLPPPETRNSITRTHIEAKHDAGDFSAALIFEPEITGKRIAAREERVRNEINEALCRLGIAYPKMYINLKTVGQ